MRKQPRLFVVIAILSICSLLSAAPASAGVLRARHRIYKDVAPTPEIWAALRFCEAGGAYDRHTGNGYYGAYQFSPRTWRGLGYTGLPHQADPAIQDEAAAKLQDRSGWGQWPGCRRKLHLH